MDIYKLKWTRLQIEVFRYLCIKSGTSINQRGIARALKVSPTAIGNSVKKLEKKNLIKATVHKTANLISWEFNRDNSYAIDIKRAENLRLIYESGLSEFLSEKFPGCTIILFGSYARGEDTINSDIDIAIIGTKGKNLEISKFEKILEREIVVNFYESLNIQKHLKNNLLNGIVLNGGIEL